MCGCSFTQGPSEIPGGNSQTEAEGQERDPDITGNQQRVESQKVEAGASRREGSAERSLRAEGWRTEQGHRAELEDRKSLCPGCNRV